MKEYRYSDIQIGQTESFTRGITVEMENAFRGITGDENPLHRDDAFAQSTGGGKFKQHVTFGMLTASLLSTLAGVYLPGKYSLIHSVERISFKQPVYAGDVLTVQGMVEDKLDGLDLILLKVKITNQEKKCVLTAGMKVLVQK